MDGREAGVREPPAEPRVESPVLEALEAVADDDDRVRALSVGKAEVAADRLAEAGDESESTMDHAGILPASTRMRDPAASRPQAPGSVKLNVQPAPVAPSLSTPTSPPILSTSRRTIDRPRPCPRTSSRERRLNGEKAFDETPFARPGP